MDDWVSSRAAGLGAKRTQAASTQEGPRHKRAADPAVSLSMGVMAEPDGDGLQKQKERGEDCAHLTWERVGWDGRTGRANAGGQPRHWQLRSPTWKPCGVGRFTGSRHAPCQSKAALGVLQILVLHTWRCDPAQQPSTRTETWPTQHGEHHRSGYLFMAAFLYATQGIYPRYPGHPATRQLELHAMWPAPCPEPAADSEAMPLLSIGPHTNMEHPISGTHGGNLQ